MDSRSPLRAALQAMGHLPGDDEPSFPVKEAQAEHLRQVVEASLTPRAVPFARGDAVHYIAGTGPMLKESRDGLVLRFWRYLDLLADYDQRMLDEALDSTFHTLPEADCLVVFFDGERCHFHLAYSAFLIAGDA